MLTLYVFLQQYGILAGKFVLIIMLDQCMWDCIRNLCVMFLLHRVLAVKYYKVVLFMDKNENQLAHDLLLFVL